MLFGRVARRGCELLTVALVTSACGHRPAARPDCAGPVRPPVVGAHSSTPEATYVEPRPVPIAWLVEHRMMGGRMVHRRTHVDPVEFSIPGTRWYCIWVILNGSGVTCHGPGDTEITALTQGYKSASLEVHDPAHPDVYWTVELEWRLREHLPPDG